MNFVEVLHVISDFYFVFIFTAVFIGLLVYLIRSIFKEDPNEQGPSENVDQLSDEITLTDEEKAFILRARRYGEAIERKNEFPAETERLDRLEDEVNYLRSVCDQVVKISSDVEKKSKDLNSIFIREKTSSFIAGLEVGKKHK